MLAKQSAGYPQYFSPPLSRLDWTLCPALIYAVSSLGRDEAGGTIAHLAEGVQSILLANRAHHPVGGAGQESLPYHILLGDYLLGLAFGRLSAADLFGYMQEFTKLIQTVNEGVVLRWRIQNQAAAQRAYISDRDWEHIHSKEKASITALSASTAARISGLSAVQTELSQKIGYHIGMAWALKSEALNAGPKWNDIRKNYMRKAEHLIMEFGGNTGVPCLLELYAAVVTELDLTE